MTSLTTFRVDAEEIVTDPSKRTDGDTTTWTYHEATGLEIANTYADNSRVSKVYNAFGQLSTVTNASGKVQTLSYVAVDASGKIGYGWKVLQAGLSVFTAS